MRPPVSRLRFLLLAVLLVAAALRLWALPHLPPGLWYDEAMNGVDARAVLEGRGLPLYFPTNYGREPLFIYWQTLFVALFGYRAFSLRLAAAFTGILTVAAVYRCGRSVFSDRRLGPWLALAGAATIATSYWHVSLSRLALRAGALPFVSALAVAALWRARMSHRRSDALIAGGLLGLTLYTYTAARSLLLLPFLVALFDWPRHAPARRAVLNTLAIVALGVVIVAAPLAWTALRRPELFSRRSEQVSVLLAQPGDERSLAARLVENTVAVARSFYDRGDAEPRHNLPGRPALDPLQAVLFTTGMLAGIATWRRPASRLLLCWLVLALLPSILSLPAPHALRAAGALPPAALLTGQGAGVLATAVTRLRRDWRSPRVLAALAAIVLLVSGTITARDYFFRWARLPGLDAAFSGAAQQVALEAADGGTLLLPSELYLQPQVAYAVGAMAERAAPPDSLPQPARFLYPPDFSPGRPGYLLWTDKDARVASRVAPLAVEEVSALGGPTALAAAEIPLPAWREGRMDLRSGPIPPALRLSPDDIPTPLEVTFADGVRLLGYAVEHDPTAPGEGARVTLTLYWSAGGANRITPAAANSDAFVHLVAAGNVYQTANGPILGAYLFPRGQVVVPDVRIVEVPPETPNGRVWFEVGLYAPVPAGAEPQRLSIVDGAGRAVADRVDLAPLILGSSPPQAAVVDLAPLQAVFDRSIELVGYRSRRAGDSLDVSLGWRAVRRNPSDYTAFIHLIDRAGRIVAQVDAPPGGPATPTTRWIPGEGLRQEASLALPPGAVLEGLTLRIGLYEPVSGRQLPLSLPPSGATFVLLPPLSPASS